MSLWVTPYPTWVGERGGYQWPWGAARWHHSTERTILSATWPEDQTLEDESRDQLQTRIKQKGPHCPTPQLPHPSPAVGWRGRNSSTSWSGAQSHCRPLRGSRRPQYVRSPKESGDVAPSHKTTSGSEEIDVMAYQIPAHGMPRMPQHIPPPWEEMQCPWAHDR
jgi:hypothetical protein